MAPLFAPLRRWLAVAIVAALMFPSLGMLATQPRATGAAEDKTLAPLPAPPRSLADLGRLPRATDAYVGDHFALRGPMLDLYGGVRRRLGVRPPPDPVVQGAPGWLLLNDGLMRSIGAEPDEAAIDRYAAFVCDLGAKMKASGKPFLFAVIPGTAAIYPEALPAWAKPAVGRTPYDVLQTRTRDCGVSSVDMRRALRAAKETGRLYRQRDSHWTPRGALIGYNLMVSALGRPDWTILPNEAEWRSEPAIEDDLAKLAGIAERAPEAVDMPHLFAFKAAPASPQPIPGLRDDPAQAAFMVGPGGRGPSILMIGDGYTRPFMPMFFAPFVGRFSWIAHRRCGFDPTVFDRTTPDYVILAVGEREARCEDGRPSG